MQSWQILKGDQKGCKWKQIVISCWDKKETVGKAKSLKILKIYRRDLCTRSETELKEPITSRNLVRVYYWNVKSASRWMSMGRRQRGCGCSPAVQSGSLTLLQFRHHSIIFLFNFFIHHSRLHMVRMYGYNTKKKKNYLALISRLTRLGQMRVYSFKGTICIHQNAQQHTHKWTNIVNYNINNISSKLIVLN